MSGPGLEYAFPHSAADEARRLELFEARLDPLTIRRIERLDLPKNARCLEIGAGHGSIARWLSTLVGHEGWVTATDVQTEFLSQLRVPNIIVQRHDVRTDPEGSAVCGFQTPDRACAAEARTVAGRTVRARVLQCRGVDD